MDLGIWPRLTKCCCCISLRVGALIIGYTSLFISVLSLSLASWSLYEVVEYMASHRDQPSPGHTLEERSRLAIGLYVAHAYLLLIYLYYCVISVLLVVGFHRNKSNYIRYYFYMGLILLALAASAVVITSVFFGIIAALPTLKWCIILFYCLIVIRSAYLDMEEQNKPQQVYEMQALYQLNPRQAPPSVLIASNENK